MQAAQAAYPGYQGMFLQPPDEKGGMWTTILRFDTAPHLEAWMAAPERRRRCSKESKAFIEHEQLTRLATAFPGWVPIDPTTGKAPPNWKAAMLVLLGLFPIVMLEMKFLSPILGSAGAACLTGHLYRKYDQCGTHELSHDAAVRAVVRMVAVSEGVIRDGQGGASSSSSLPLK